MSTLAHGSIINRVRIGFLTATVMSEFGRQTQKSDQLIIHLDGFLTHY
jgi:hypothetical protein